MSDPDSKNTPARSRDASPSESDGVDAAQIQFGDQAAHLASPPTFSGSFPICWIKPTSPKNSASSF